jgi:hypothetical protein
MLLFTQMAILLGLIIQLVMFAFLLWYGRPADSSETALVQQFFLVAALWVITINVGVALFWWVSKQGDWPIDLSEFLEEDETSPDNL